MSRPRKILLILGLSLCLSAMVYPALADRIYTGQSSRIFTEYREIVADTEDLSAEWEACAAYNERLRLRAKTVASRFEAADFTEKEYGKRLDPMGNGIMAYLKIPKLGLTLPVYHGSGEESLTKGIGHMPETSLPIGGPGCHAALTGHSGLADKVLFTELNRLTEGDEFVIIVLGEEHRYRVRSSATVLPHETERLDISDGEDLVTLITCTPYGLNTHRLLVTGVRVTEEE